jgi:hypothetical protein
MDLEQRIRMAAESILENESLREGLDDEAATVLLDWGVARAKQIASETADLEDETEAEEAAYPRMLALRQILRAAASLCAENVEPAQQTELLQEIANQVPLVYGPAAAVFETSTWANVPIAQLGNPVQIIKRLRASIENSAKDFTSQTPAVDNIEKKEVQKEQEIKKRNFLSDWFSKR